MPIASLLLMLGLVIAYGIYLVVKIGSGTVWPPRRLSFFWLALVLLLSLLIPWAGQSAVHFLMGYKVHPIDPDILSWLPKVLLFAPLIETLMVGGVYAISRLIPATRIANIGFILITSGGAVLLHRHGMFVMVLWYFAFFAAQAAFFVWALPRLGHVRTLLTVTAIHGLGNLGIMTSVFTTHALRNMG